MKHTLWSSMVRYFMIGLGAFIGALSVVVFMAPFEIAPGGVSGVAVILNRLFNTPIGVMVFILNIPIQYLGYRMLPGGLRTVAQTIYVLIIYSVALDVLGPYFSHVVISQDRLLNALFGGIVGGIGGGLIYRNGGTFGGTSTLALIIQRRSGTPMSSTFLYTDLGVIIVAGLVFGLEPALYATVALFVSGLATDYIMEGPSVIRTVVIITDKPNEVSQAIIHGLHRSVTAWSGRGMYTEVEHGVLYVTISRPQVRELRDIVSQIDDRAFVVIGIGHAAYGTGFRKMGPNQSKKLPAPDENGTAL